MNELPFIVSKDELREHVAVGLALELYTLAPAAQRIAVREVQQLIGNVLYEALVSAYGGGAEPISEKKYADLLPYAQRIIANLSVAEAMDVSQVQISESGVLRTEKGDAKTAYHYQKLEAQEALRRAGYAAQEDLIAFLEANLDNYEEYKTSEAYTQAQQYFISSARQFDQQYSIGSSRRTYRALMPLMYRAEHLQVRQVIGEELFNHIKAEQTTGTLSADNKIILVYIRLAVAHLSIADAVHELSLEVTPRGVQLSQTLATGGGQEEKKQPSRARLDHLAERCEGLGRRHLDHLREYLIKHASADRYATFFNSPLYPQAPDTAGPRDNAPSKKRIYGAL